MIYRCDFNLKSTNINIVSPVIFSNVAKVLFEVFEDDAENFIKKIIDSNTLISDMLIYGKYPCLKITDSQFESDETNKIDRLKSYRKWKKSSKADYNLNGIKNTRIRIENDRKTGSTKEGILFYEDETFYNDLFSVYVYTEDERVIDLFELAFEIFERCGFGTDTSVGIGQINIKRYEGKIFTKDEDMLKSFKDTNPVKYSLSSAITEDNILKDYEIIKYTVSRYDSRSLDFVKPPYYLIDKGSIIKVKGSIKPYIYRLKDLYIYSCIFPISI